MLNTNITNPQHSLLIFVSNYFKYKEISLEQKTQTKLKNSNKTLNKNYKTGKLEQNLEQK